MPRALKLAIAGGLSLLAAAALALALLSSFDWNRARPWLQQKVEQVSGRSFVVNGDMRLSWHAPEHERGWRAWIPWPRLQAHEVVFGNAPWSARPVMASARTVTFSVNPLALLQKRVDIPALALESPEILLERQADGRNNWRIGNGDGAWRFSIGRLSLDGGRIAIDDAVRRLTLTAHAGPAPDAGLAWRLEGSMEGEAFDGTGRSASLLDLHNDDAAFPVAVRIRSGSTDLDAEGTMTAPLTRLGFDLQLRVAGVSMARLYALTGLLLPETPPFSTAGRLIAEREEEGMRWQYENFSGKMGATDLRGDLDRKSVV